MGCEKDGIKWSFRRELDGLALRSDTGKIPCGSRNAQDKEKKERVSRKETSSHIAFGNSLVFPYINKYLRVIFSSWPTTIHGIGRIRINLLHDMSTCLFYTNNMTTSKWRPLVHTHRGVGEIGGCVKYLHILYCFTYYKFINF